MKIIISPAKKMNKEMDSLEVTGVPDFMNDAIILMHDVLEIKTLGISEQP